MTTRIAGLGMRWFVVLAGHRWKKGQWDGSKLFSGNWTVGRLKNQVIVEGVQEWGGTPALNASARGLLIPRSWWAALRILSARAGVGMERAQQAETNSGAERRRIPGSAAGGISVRGSGQGTGDIMRGGEAMCGVVFLWE